MNGRVKCRVSNTKNKVTTFRHQISGFIVILLLLGYVALKYVQEVVEKIMANLLRLGRFVFVLVMPGALILFFMSATVAQAYMWPVLDTVDIEIISSTDAKYTGRWISIELDASTDGPGNQYMGVLHRHVRTGANDVTTGAMQYSVNMRAYDCPDYLFSCIGPQWIANNGRSGSYVINHSGQENGNECVGISTSATLNHSEWTSIRHPNVLAAQCLGTPPVDEWCALATPTIEFNYGRMALQNAVGKQLTRTVEIQCTAGINYVLRLQGASSIALDNGMHASFTTDGDVPLGETLDGVSGKQFIQLTSTLQGTPTEGPFSGSGVLFVSYP